VVRAIAHAIFSSDALDLLSVSAPNSGALR
jgi:hypothetical protein